MAKIPKSDQSQNTSRPEKDETPICGEFYEIQIKTC
jgi:hypothetical protein